MSYLAQRFDKGLTRLSSEDVSKVRHLPQPLVAKLLSTLSTAGLVKGSRGPGGGYWLAKSPEKISLADIAGRFERESDGILCPFGPGWCGSNDPCPLHDRVMTFSDEWNAFLKNTTLAVFSAGDGPLDDLGETETRGH